MKEIFVFGTSNFSQMLAYYEEEQYDTKISGYTLNKEYINGDEVLSYPLVPFEELVRQNENVSILIGIGYNRMNNMRKEIYKQVKEAGIQILSFVHPTSVIADNVSLGEGTIIMANTVIEPFVKMGDGNIFWSNVMITHNNYIGDFNFFGAGCVVAGECEIGSCCFFGTNSTVRNNLKISDRTLVGAGAYLDCNSNEGSVIVPHKSVMLENKISDDIRI